MKKLTKEQHRKNFEEIRSFLEKYNEYEIKIDSLEFFIDTELKFVLKGRHK